MLSYEERIKLRDELISLLSSDFIYYSTKLKVYKFKNFKKF